MGDRGADVFASICEEMQYWCTNEGVDDIGSMVGGMHKELKKRGIESTMKHK